MRDELVQRLSQTTGLAHEKAQEVVNFVLSHLKEKLPARVASDLDSYLAGGSFDTGSLADEARSKGIVFRTVGKLTGRPDGYFSNEAIEGDGHPG
jgi:hypothetical protein